MPIIFLLLSDVREPSPQVSCSGSVFSAFRSFPRHRAKRNEMRPCVAGFRIASGDGLQRFARRHVCSVSQYDVSRNTENNVGESCDLGIESRAHYLSWLRVPAPSGSTEWQFQRLGFPRKGHPPRMLFSRRNRPSRKEMCSRRVLSTSNSLLAVCRHDRPLNSHQRGTLWPEGTRQWERFCKCALCLWSIPGLFVIRDYHLHQQSHLFWRLPGSPER
jgi:hypothetical protein